MQKKTISIDTRFFRAGVGTVIYNSNKQVALFKRAQYPAGVWQFQQGGIDLNEQPDETLWRELKEEVGLEKTDIVSIDEMPGWTLYEEETDREKTSEQRFGQAHHWYFLRVSDVATIDLSQATEDEFCDYRWTTFADAINETRPAKQDVYRKLQNFFSEIIER